MNLKETLESIQTDVEQWELYKNVAGVLMLFNAQNAFAVARKSYIGSEEKRRIWIRGRLSILANTYEIGKIKNWSKLEDAMLFFFDALSAGENIAEKILKMKQDAEVIDKKASAKYGAIRVVPNSTELSNNLVKMAVEEITSNNSLEASSRLAIFYTSLTYYDKKYYVK